jgi:hypothetical protein
LFRRPICLDFDEAARTFHPEQESLENLIGPRPFAEWIVVSHISIIREQGGGCRWQPSKHLSVRVAPRTPTFHPKVIVARFVEKSAFAIVGSGNLTGGQCHNVECGIFLTASDHIRELENWLRKLKAKIEVILPASFRFRPGKSAVSASPSMPPADRCGSV